MSLISNYNSKKRIHFNNSELCVHHLVNELNYWFDDTNEFEEMFDFCCRLKLQQLIEYGLSFKSIKKASLQTTY